MYYFDFVLTSDERIYILYTQVVIRLFIENTELIY